MKQLKNVLKFEYITYLKSKAFIGITIFLMAVIIILTNIPTFKKAYDIVTNNSEKASDTADERKIAVLFDPQNDYSDETLKEYFPQYDWVKVDEFVVSEIEENITSGEYAFGLAIDGLKYTRYQKGTDAMFGSVYGIDDMIQNVYRNKLLLTQGLSQAEIDAVNSVKAEGDFVSLGKDLRQSYWVGYAMLMLLYMTIIMYGQQVMVSVITEKSSKTMELLITSVKPVYLVFGKVFGAGLAGLTQLCAIIITAVVSLGLTSPLWVEFSPMVAEVTSLTATTGIFLYALLFFVLGFFIFAFLYAAFASTVSRMEDASKVTMVPMLLFVAAFLVAMLSMSNPGAAYVTVCSFVPFLSPLVMFMRICVTDVPFYQILTAIVINILSIIAAGIMSGKIYKVGVLMYGKPPKLTDIFKYIIKA